jgi:hypothetical protein
VSVQLARGPAVPRDVDAIVLVRGDPLGDDRTGERDPHRPPLREVGDEGALVPALEGASQPAASFVAGLVVPPHDAPIGSDQDLLALHADRLLGHGAALPG